MLTCHSLELPTTFKLTYMLPAMVATAASEGQDGRKLSQCASKAAGPRLNCTSTCNVRAPLGGGRQATGTRNEATAQPGQHSAIRADTQEGLVRTPKDPTGLGVTHSGPCPQNTAGRQGPAGPLLPPNPPQTQEPPGPGLQRHLPRVPPAMWVKVAPSETK